MSPAIRSTIFLQSIDGFTVVPLCVFIYISEQELFLTRANDLRPLIGTKRMEMANKRERRAVLCLDLGQTMNQVYKKPI